MENSIEVGKKRGGRPKGALNKATREVKIAAQKYTNKALKTLSRIMENGESEPARVAAAKELLDRGYGKASQSVEHTGEGGGPISVHLKFVGSDE